MSARRCLLLLVPLVLLLAACADAQEAVDETPAASPSAQPSETPTTAPPAEDTPTPTPSGIGALPSPEPGYRWFSTPEDELSYAYYAVQVPSDFVGSGGTFVPPASSPDLPYTPLPRLRILAAPTVLDPPDTHAGWEHPFVWGVGRQGGGGCVGDVNGHYQASPSGQYVSEIHTWDIFLFTCGQASAADLPATTYDGRAAETRAGDTIIAIVVLEPVGTASMEEALQVAMDSFTLR